MVVFLGPLYLPAIPAHYSASFQTAIIYNTQHMQMITLSFVDSHQEKMQKSLQNSYWKPPTKHKGLDI